MTDTTTTPDVAATIDAYFAMLNETDPGRRAELAGQAWADDAVYVDPLSLVTGPAAIADMIGAVHQQYPGQRFSRTSGIDAHHTVVRFEWQLADDDGNVTVPGLDVGVIADDGRLSRIAAFFGPLPAA